MPYTPATVALLQQIRRAQGRPLRSGAADIGIQPARQDSDGWSAASPAGHDRDGGAHDDQHR